MEDTLRVLCFLNGETYIFTIEIDNDSIDHIDVDTDPVPVVSNGHVFMRIRRLNGLPDLYIEFCIDERYNPEDYIYATFAADKIIEPTEEEELEMENIAIQWIDTLKEEYQYDILDNTSVIDDIYNNDLDTLEFDKLLDVVRQVIYDMREDCLTQVNKKKAVDMSLGGDVNYNSAGIFFVSYLADNLTDEEYFNYNSLFWSKMLRYSEIRDKLANYVNAYVGKLYLFMRSLIRLCSTEIDYDRIKGGY